MKKVSDLPQYLIARTVGSPADSQPVTQGVRLAPGTLKPVMGLRAPRPLAGRGLSLGSASSSSPGEHWMHVLRSGLFAGMCLITTGFITVETCFVTELLLLVVKLIFNYIFIFLPFHH